MKKPGLSVSHPKPAQGQESSIQINYLLGDRKNDSIFDDGEGKIKAFLKMIKYALTEKLPPALPCPRRILGGFQAIVL